jgi:hypothetical protein
MEQDRYTTQLLFVLLSMEQQYVFFITYAQRRVKIVATASPFSNNHKLHSKAITRHKNT